TRHITELACVIALDPVLLLLDEPSSGIAQRESEALGELLARLRRHLDCTMVVIEHDIPLLMGLSTRVVAMDPRRVIAAGTPDEVRANAQVVESYLGADVAAIERSGVAVRDTQHHDPRPRVPQPTGSASSRARSGPHDPHVECS